MLAATDLKAMRSGNSCVTMADNTGQGLISKGIEAGTDVNRK